MNPGKSCVLIILLLLTACQTSEVLNVEPAGDAPQADQSVPSIQQTETPIDRGLLREECALYYAVVGKMDLENRKPPNSIVEGCPPQTSIGADISPNGSFAGGSKAGTLRQKMIARGIPGDIVDQAVRSSAFRDWLNAAR